MSDAKIVASARNQQSPGAMLPDSGRSWSVLGWSGLAFWVVGGTDFLLAWFPMSFGNAEWEFATVTQTFNGLPILLLGLGLLTAAAQSTERSWWWLLALGGSTALLIAIVGGSVVWVLNVQLALETVPDELRLGIQRAVAKTSVQSAVYTLLLVYLIRRGWSAGRSEAAG